MKINLSQFVRSGDTVAVALSGGRDSMALLYYMQSNAEKFHINVIALNVEHGIRGEASLSDTRFVKTYCANANVPLLLYSVDAPKRAKDEKLSLEQAARILRYECFFDAISNGKCDKIATAHHLDDNVESVLFNLFRGTGVKGAIGIEKTYGDKIIRPFLSVPKTEIEKFAKERSLPFVTDQTNFSCDYTRNALRLKVIPEIKKLFPKMPDGILRFTEILNEENDFLDKECEKVLSISQNKAEVRIPCHRAIFSRAAVKAVKALGIVKDYEKIHIDGAYALAGKKNGGRINLPQGVIAVKEYDKIVFYKESSAELSDIPFSVGEFSFCEKTIAITRDFSSDLKSGLFIDADKIPDDAVIRFRKSGDVFTKFGGGTKNLGDYFTDKKIPLRERDALPLIASGKNVLAIFGVAISEKVKVDPDAKNVLRLKIEDKKLEV